MSKTSSKSSASKARLKPFWAEVEKRLLIAIDEQQKNVDFWRAAAREAASRESTQEVDVTWGILMLRRVAEAKADEDRLRAALHEWALLSE